VDYSALALGIEVSEAHSAITESHASNSSVEKEAFAYMAGTPREVANHFEEQAQVQRSSSIRFVLSRNLLMSLSRC